MMYRKLLMLIALAAFVPSSLWGQNLAAPYPQRNALDYLLYWGDSTRMGNKGSLASWGSQVTLSVGGGVEYLLYPRTAGASSFTPLSRVQLGWWFTPVSAIEVGGSFGLVPPTEDRGYSVSRSGELNYLFNFSKFATRNANFQHFSFVGLIGVQYASFTNDTESGSWWGAHAGFRGIYHMRRGMNIFIEPRLTYYPGGYPAASTAARGYALAPSLSVGMQLRLRNIDRYDASLFKKDTEREDAKFTYAIKTNLLYGGLAFAPNLGVEMLLSRRFTLEATVGGNFFEAAQGDLVERSLRHIKSELSGRYWLDKSFRGAFASIHSLYAHYDISGHSLPLFFGESRTDVGYKGNAYGGGISVGYLWRLSNHLGLEAELGAGYMAMNYDRQNYSSGELSQNIHRSYVGPTKASLSLVYMFDGAKIDLRKINLFPTRDNLLPFDMAIKTNLLYAGLALTPNLGVEIGLSDRMTLDMGVGYNGWNLNSDPKRKLVHTMYQAGPRYWTRKRFDGFFTGGHLLYADYNISGYNLPLLFGSGSNNYRFQGNGYGAGLSVGYLWRIGRRLGIEVEVGGGYARMQYDKYENVNCGRVIETGIGADYFGPTKAALSFVYLLNAPKVDFKRLNPLPYLFPKRDDLLEYSIALKTNLLYSGVAFTPNIGVEIGLSKQVTLDMAAGYNPWGLNSGQERFLVHSMYHVGARYWTRERFDGFFAGGHLLYTDYNISHHRLPMLFGSRSSNYRFQGYGYGGGLSVGYLWRVGKRLGIEAEVGAGYARLEYDKYDCVNCGRVIEKGANTNYFGPTKAALSLVYMIK